MCWASPKHWRSLFLISSKPAHISVQQRGNGCLADMYYGDFICTSTEGLVCDQWGLSQNRNMTTAHYTHRSRPFCIHRIHQLLHEIYLLFLCWLIDLFSKNLPPLRRESWYYCCQCWPSCPLKTQVFLNIASCFQTVIWCCEHPQPVQLLYSFRLAACVWRAMGELHSERGKWSELCLHRGIQLCPQSSRSPTTIPCEH